MARSPSKDVSARHANPPHANVPATKSAAEPELKAVTAHPLMPTTKGSFGAIALGNNVAAFDSADNGYENVTARDLLIPRMTIIQALSPQVNPLKPEYDPEAKAGDVYDVGMQQTFPDGILFIPVFYQKSWLEWAPRASGKGLQGIHLSESILEETTRDERRRSVLPNGNYIAETAQFYGFNMTAGGRKSFVPMTSTQLKKARLLLTLATIEKVQRPDGSEFTPPIFFRSYELRTGPESNNEGSWNGWRIERGPLLVQFDHWQDLLAEIKEFRASLAAGTLRGDLANMEEDAGGPVIDHDSPM